MANQHRPTPGQVRLQAALRKEVLEAGSYLALQADLEEAIDRRKLKRLVDLDRDTPITFSELHALDTFLRRKGHGGLSSIFRSTDLLQAIAELPKTTFLLGFKPESLQPGARTWISHWDLRSVAVLLQGLYRYHASSRLQVDLEEVLLRQQPSLESVNKESWFELIESQQGSQSLIAIGSPKACHASEILLSKMIDVEPFKSRGASPWDDLPLQFEWTVEQLERTPSSFAYAETSEQMLKPAFKNFTSFSLRFQGESFVVPFDEDQWKDYGIIVAQRRANGSIWAVCAGLSGPATLAAARMLAKEQIDLPPLRRNQTHSDPVFRVVEAEVVRGDTPTQGDSRKLVREYFGAGTAPPPAVTDPAAGEIGDTV